MTHLDSEETVASVTPINTRLYIADPSLTKVVAASAIAGVVGAVWLNAVVNLCTPWKGFK